MVDRFRIQGMNQDTMYFYILNKNDSKGRIYIDWEILDQYRTYLWNTGEEAE